MRKGSLKNLCLGRFFDFFPALLTIALPLSPLFQPQWWLAGQSHDTETAGGLNRAGISRVV